MQNLLKEEMAKNLNLKTEKFKSCMNSLHGLFFWLFRHCVAYPNGRIRARIHRSTDRSKHGKQCCGSICFWAYWIRIRIF